MIILYINICLFISCQFLDNNDTNEIVGVLSPRQVLQRLAILLTEVNRKNNP